MEDIEVPFPVARNYVPMPPWATPSSYHSYGYSGSVSPAPALTQTPAVQPATYTQRIQSSSAPQMTIIALKGGSAFLAQEYWIEGGQMHCVSASREEKLLPLDKIDLSQTVRVNQERNVDFVLQSRDAAEQ
jgi:hypothetical protein